MPDLRLIERGPGPVEVVHDLDLRESGRVHAALARSGLAAQVFAFNEPLKIVQMRPVLLRRLPGKDFVVLCEVCQFEIVELAAPRRRWQGFGRRGGHDVLW